MAKKQTAKKKRQPDYQQLARKVTETIAPDAEPKAIKPAKEPRPPKRDQETTGGKAEGQEKNPAAVALGRLGGLKGGRARAEKLSAAKRKAIAKKAAAKRWSKKAAPGGH